MDQTGIPPPASRYFITAATLVSDLMEVRDEILPGMPIEAFLQTGERTVLSYSTRRPSDRLRHAFRDD